MKLIPKSWKEYLINNKTVNTHSWEIIGGSGSGKNQSRSWSPMFNEDLQLIHIKYKCRKCKITSKKYIYDFEYKLDNEDYLNLSCDEIIIKDIIE
jgi:hypothetical protein